MPKSLWKFEQFPQPRLWINLWRLWITPCIRWINPRDLKKYVNRNRQLPSIVICICCFDTNCCLQRSLNGKCFNGCVGNGFIRFESLHNLLGSSDGRRGRFGFGTGFRPSCRSKSIPGGTENCVPYEHVVTFPIQQTGPSAVFIFHSAGAPGFGRSGR